MIKATHWVVVADSSTATIYASDDRLDELVPIDGFHHDRSRLPARELVSDDRGRTQALPGGARSAIERRTSLHEHEVETFAKELAQVLRKGVDDDAFEAIVLAASPVFLGHLRTELDPRTAARVVGSVAHDYTRIVLGELPALLRKSLADPVVHWRPASK
jgi:protein required for attachment to host cells